MQPVQQEIVQPVVYPTPLPSPPIPRVVNSAVKTVVRSVEPPRKTDGNLVDDVNKFVHQSSGRRHASELEQFGTYFDRSARAAPRSDIESAFSKMFRGNIFEPKFII